MHTLKILNQAHHLLEGVEVNDEEVQKEIEQLKAETRGLIHLCTVGHEVAAQVGLRLLGVKIDEIVEKIGRRDTERPPK